MPIPTHRALRYVTPLREGGSLPAIVETDAGLVVAKFRGAGQGARALVAELIVGGLAEALDLPVPALALVDAADDFGRAEPDPEIQDILRGSRGTNVGMGYVEGAFSYDPVAASDLIDPDLAAGVVWLDALTTNIDRTARNPNLLVAGDPPQLWLIDHGAALYFHHNWPGVDEARAKAPFVQIKDHVLLPASGDIEEADARLAPRLTDAAIEDVLAHVPDDLLMDAPEGRTAPFETPEANREAYAHVLPPEDGGAARVGRRGRPRPGRARLWRGRRAPPLPPLACSPTTTPSSGSSRTSTSATARRWAPSSSAARGASSASAGARRQRRWARGGRGSVRGLVARYLCAIERVASGEGPLGHFTASERFHWLTATRSTVVQPSPVHTGVTDDPEAALARIVRSLAP